MSGPLSDADLDAIRNEHLANRPESTHWGDCHLAHPRCAIAVLDREVWRLRAELDAAQLRSIEARNPGIDMERVKREREER